jgi:hypothetical protein
MDSKISSYKISKLDLECLHQGSVGFRLIEIVRWTILADMYRMGGRWHGGSRKVESDRAGLTSWLHQVLSMQGRGFWRKRAIWEVSRWPCPWTLNIYDLNLHFRTCKIGLRTPYCFLRWLNNKNVVQITESSGTVRALQSCVLVQSSVFIQSIFRYIIGFELCTSSVEKMEQVLITFSPSAPTHTHSLLVPDRDTKNGNDLCKLLLELVQKL